MTPPLTAAQLRRELADAHRLQTVSVAQTVAERAIQAVEALEDDALVGRAARLCAERGQPLFLYPPGTNRDGWHALALGMPNADPPRAPLSGRGPALSAAAKDLVNALVNALTREDT